MQKQKKSGFTMIELLVVITIVGILATASVPSISSAVEKNRYKNNSEKIFAMLNDARANALAGKRCPTVPSGSEPGIWRFAFVPGTMDVPRNRIKLQCLFDANGENGIEEEDLITELYDADGNGTVTSLPLAELIEVDFFVPTDASDVINLSSPNTSVSFLPSTAQVRMTGGNDFAVGYENSRLGHCFRVDINRINGYPIKYVDLEPNCTLP